MKKETKKPENSSGDDKLSISGAEKTQEELLREYEALERKKREENDRRLSEERLELIRLKQGVIEESEAIHEEKEEEIKLTFPKKISNFFYHNKWWLGMGVIAAVTVVWFFASILSRPNPDMTIMVIGDNQALGEESDLSGYFEKFAGDLNGNGKTEVEVHYIAYTDDYKTNYANGVDTKLTTHMQSSEAVIVIAGPDVPDIMKTTEVFDDLSERYPDNVNVRNYAFMLSGTEFAAKVGLGFGGLPEGWFMAIRTPKKLMYTSEKAMQETYDKDLPVFDAVIRDLSGE